MSASSPFFARGLLVALLVTTTTMTTSSTSSFSQDGEREYPTNFAKIVAATDYACVLRHWRIRGVGVCIRDGHPRPCLKVENPWPVGLVEITRREYASPIQEADALLSHFAKPARELAQAATGDAAQQHGSHTPYAHKGSSLHYAEAHVYQYAAPPANLIAGGLPLAVPCGRTFPLLPVYLSELDAYGWRDESVDGVFFFAGAAGSLRLACDVQWPANLAGCAGPWGPYLPRVGWASHPSSPVAACLQAMRATSVASAPGWLRVKLGPYGYPPLTGHFFQLVHPVVRGCERIGSPLVAKIEAGAGSADGTYVLVHFAVLRQCIGCDGCGKLAPPMNPAGP